MDSAQSKRQTEVSELEDAIAADKELLVPPPATEMLRWKKYGRYQIRLLQREECKLALDFYRTIGEPVPAWQQWDWRFYSRNPELIYVMGAFTSQGELVGLYPGTFRPIRADGRDYLGQQSCRTLVHPDHRGGGRLFIGLLKFAFELCTSMGAHIGYGGGAAEAALKMGAWVLGNVKICELQYQERRLSLRPALQRRFGALGAGSAKLLDRFGKTDLGFRTGAYEVRTIHQISSEFDELWLRKRDSYRILVRRDAREINWRWLQCPISTTVLGVFHAGALEGYLALRHHVRDGIRISTVLDLFTGRNEVAAAALLAAAGADAKKAGSSFLETACKQNCDGYATTQQAPWRASRNRPDLVIGGKTSSQSEQAGLAEMVSLVEDGDNWFYCLGDSDYFD